MSSPKPEELPGSAAPSRRRALILHGDPEEAQRLCQALENTGQILAYTRPDGAAGLATIYEEPPDMLIIDHGLPPKGGPRLCVELKADNLFAHLPILMLAPPGTFGPGADWEQCPADDFLASPFDETELQTRADLCFARAGRELDANPLTRLPGNNTIIKEIERRLAVREPFAAAYIDIDNFKSYNDRYGFTRGDEALRMTARLVINAVQGSGSANPFAGHIGGDDFVFIVQADHIDNVCRALIQNFDLIVRSLYDEEDRVRGFIDSVNRKGERERFPIMTLSVSVATNAYANLTHYGQVSSIVTEIKKKLKKETKSNYLVDRRSAPSEDVRSPSEPASGGATGAN
jgi:diguanylate cyclase (GGDEF)-like protein